MFAAYVVEYCDPPGLSAYGLAGTPPDPGGTLPYRGFVESRGSGSKWLAIALSPASGKWEEFFGTVTDGSPLDTLSRTTILRSWDGTALGTDAVDWQSSDGTLKVFATPVADFLDGVTTTNRGSSAPAWAVPGTKWMDTTGAPTAVVYKMMDAGGDWITLGTFNETANTFVPSGLDGVLPLAGGTLTGAILVPAGTSGAPSIARAGNTDTGISFDTADEIAVVINATKRLNITGSGAAVTGTLSASTTVTATDGTDSVQLVGSDGGIEILRDGGGAYIDFKNASGDDNDIRLYQTGASEFTIATAGSARVVVSGSGVTINPASTFASTVGITGNLTISAGLLSAGGSVASIAANGTLGPAVFTIATLPSAAANNWRVAIVSDAATTTHLVYSSTSTWIAASGAQIGPS